jgi:hypothetical protein
MSLSDGHTLASVVQIVVSIVIAEYRISASCGDESQT